ncbi:type IV secretion system protein [uncultured Sulfitobacter sp.]|uniref:type IV secretion system protein n=2 Tax=Roseobacteraceae TaxID=2854170 RepID=UPI0022C3E01F|nr:type IV secretion system protein [uncultured Sulfitobacter sp.]MCZ4354785.1 type IV secretion system protein [Roseovarius aestuarii]
MMADDPKNVLEAEIIYGAMQREKIWKIAFAGMAVTAAVAVFASAAVMVWHKPPAPIVVPFDPTTGMAVPNASVEAVTLDERAAVVQALVYQYVTDRETYNQIDNDLRINRALARTKGTARRGLVELWDSSSERYLPDRYGDRTQVDVVVTGITLLDEDRVQVRMRKRLTNPDGSNTGNFTAVIGYDFEAEEQATLEAVWRNPLGFVVTDYELYQDRRG